MFIDNNWYGNRYILCKYLNLKDKAVFASIQHGYISFNTDTIFKKRTFSKIPWLVWNSFFQKKLSIDGHKNVFAIGAPFLYLHRMLGVKKIKSKGTLIIPSKSQYEINMIVNYDKLYKFVKKKFAGPYVILVGYHDLKRAILFKNKYKDLKFICCGRRKNKFFTFNLYNYINKYKNILHFYPGSALFYSIFLKKKTYYFVKRFVTNLSGKGVCKKNNNQVANLLKEDKDIIDRIKKEVNLDFKDLNTLKNYNRAKLALGYASFMNKKDLLKHLGLNLNLKVFFAIILQFLHRLISLDLFRSKY